jgi:hypothetical protein
MAQGKGAMMQLLFQRNTGAYRATPSPADAVKLPFTSWNVGRDPMKTDDPSISASPLPGKKFCGDAELKGSGKAILCLRSIGYWLSLVLGAPTANKAVTKQPTNVTGVTVNYAHASCTAGNGTLEFAATGTTLAWTAQGDTAGTPVDVSAGGYFTLQSGTVDHSIHVTVAAASLPATDKSDADIAVSTTLKTHSFPINLTDRPDALVELGHTDLTKFYRQTGIKVNKLSYDVTAKDQDISLDILGAAETEETSAFDATPTSFESVRACGSGGKLTDGAGTTLGTVVSGDVGFDNGMTGILLPDGLEGYGLIDQGDLKIGGKLKTVFDGAGAYALARADTSTRLRLESKALVGSDVFSLVQDMPAVSLVEKAPAKEGKSGLFVELEWYAHRLTSGALPLVLLTNDVASY